MGENRSACLDALDKVENNMSEIMNGAFSALQYLLERIKAKKWAIIIIVVYSGLSVYSVNLLPMYWYMLFVPSFFDQWYLSFGVPFLFGCTLAWLAHINRYVFYAALGIYLLEGFIVYYRLP